MDITVNDKHDNVIKQRNTSLILKYIIIIIYSYFQLKVEKCNTIVCLNNHGQ